MQEDDAVQKQNMRPGKQPPARLLPMLSGDRGSLSLADPFFAETLFDQLSDVVFFVKDVAGRYVVVNTTLLHRCGLQHKAQLIGHLPGDVFPAELGASYAAQDRYVLESGEAIHDRLELHLYPNRAHGWCLTHKIPLVAPVGRVVALAGISRDLRIPDAGHPAYRRIADVITHVQQNYAEPLTIASLARQAGLSVAQFERHVRRIFGLSPKQLIIKTRMERGAQLLHTNRTIAEIAYVCGYADHSAFSRQFKTTVGLSPTGYRILAQHSTTDEALRVLRA